jgi:hypothetical protein
VAERLTEAPRLYADANLPSGLVRFMRERLGWDVLFVMEDESLRRAADVHHFRLSTQLRRTLITLDRDYLDDQRFPAGESAGVIVMSAPNEEQFRRLLLRIDTALFPRAVEASPGTDHIRMPLAGRKVHLHSDWNGDL